ncbi:hypothetical protein L596_026132 [Steinernema carpocapsae]|uniref:Uncharacterized protein n=1 Tax=Steinernema carpocapsae TaxID=34508 RepID=A0A4V5ZYB4_STECR|nr:hypothetical protein L596_026132 [Steinernema carpocapsae]
MHASKAKKDADKNKVKRRKAKIKNKKLLKFWDEDKKDEAEAAANGKKIEFNISSTCLKTVQTRSTQRSSLHPRDYAEPPDERVHQGVLRCRLELEEPNG